MEVYNEKMSEYRIFEYTEYLSTPLMPRDLQAIKLDLLPIKKTLWKYSRGAKTERLYVNEQDEPVFKVEYTYTNNPDNRSIKEYFKHIYLYANDGSVAAKIDASPIYNSKQVKEINRAIRQGRMDYLEDGAENLRLLAATLPEPYKSGYLQVADSIDLLFSHYRDQVNDYISRGTMDFESAVLNETDAAVLGILGITARQPDADFPNGLTVKQSIIYQLTGVKP